MTIEERIDNLHKRIVLAKNDCHVPSGPAGGQFCSGGGKGIGGSGLASAAHKSTYPIMVKYGFSHERISENIDSYHHSSGAGGSINRKGEWSLSSAPVKVTSGAAYGMPERSHITRETSYGRGPAELKEHLRRYGDTYTKAHI